jgi:hypothetical protein
MVKSRAANRIRRGPTRSRRAKIVDLGHADAAQNTLASGMLSAFPRIA